jgi:MFS family permease
VAWRFKIFPHFRVAAGTAKYKSKNPKIIIELFCQSRRWFVLFSSYRGLPKEAKFLIISAVLPFVAYGMFYTDLSFFLSSVQGISLPTMGIIVTVMGLSTFVASIPLGVAADKYGRRRMFIIGNVMASLIIAVFALTTNIFVLLVAAIFEGIAEAAFAVSANALLAEKAQETRRTHAYSLFGFVQSIAFGVGSLMIPVVMIFEGAGFTNVEGHVLLYVLLAVLSLSSTLLMLRITEPRREKRHGVSWRNLLPHKSKDPLFRYILASGLIAFGAGLVVPLMSAWFGLRYGITDGLSGPVLGVSSLITGVATLSGPWFARKIGLVKAITVTQGFSTVFMFLIPLSPNYATAGFTYTLRSFLMNMATPLEQSMIMGICVEDERSAALGLSSALWSLPNALSTFLGAFLMGLGLLAAPFILAGLLYVVSVSMFWYFFRKTKLPEDPVDCTGKL